MDITTEYKGVYLHHHGEELMAITHKGQLLKISEMKDSDREDFYGVDKVQTAKMPVL